MAAGATGVALASSRATGVALVAAGATRVPLASPGFRKATLLNPQYRNVAFLNSGPPPEPGPGLEAGAPPEPDGGDLASRARAAYERAVAAQRRGDWAAYGEALEELGGLLESLSPE